MASPTLRQVAKLANVSLATASYALRNRPQVSAQTCAHVQAVAKQAGYKPNPMVTTLMTNHRKSGRRRQVRAIIACFISERTEALIKDNRSLRECFEGARSACEESGFVFEKFRWQDFGESPKRLFSVLQARNVPGVIFQGSDVPPWCLDGWDAYALASAANPRPSLLSHFASEDHYRDVLLCIKRLTTLGYHRIGFAISREDWIDRADYRPLAAFSGWMLQLGGSAKMTFWTERWNREKFLTWVEKQKPDVIISSQHEPLEYLRTAGYRIPEDIGFAHLDLTEQTDYLAGIRQNSFEVGRATGHLVISQINRNTYGIPKHPRSIFVAGDWHDGSSVRQH